MNAILGTSKKIIITTQEQADAVTITVINPSGQEIITDAPATNESVTTWSYIFFTDESWEAGKYKIIAKQTTNNIPTVDRTTLIFEKP